MNTFYLKIKTLRACVVSAVLTVSLVFLQLYAEGNVYAPSQARQSDSLKSETSSGFCLFGFWCGQDDVYRALSSADARIYRDIFAALNEGNIDEADKLTRRIKDRRLIGYVQAQKFLSKEYKARPHELKSWLARYSDYPQAGGIYSLAIARGATGLKQPSSGEKTISMRARSFNKNKDGNNNAADSGSKEISVKNTWEQGLAAWKKGDIKSAAALFSLIAEQSELLHTEESAAGAYWASRAFEELNDERSAWKFREIAARHTHTFYGLTAAAELGLKPSLLWDKPKFTQKNEKILTESPSGRRVFSLVAAEQYDMAEKELLRMNFSDNPELKKAVLSYALHVDLPSVALHLAGHVETENGEVYDSAFYPLSSWEPDGGYRVDPSLVHAVIRQESRFQISARSVKGAGGLMQVMPQTAQYIAEKYGYADELEHMNPEANLRLGQDYLLYLLEDAAVSGDMISMLIAYNAGPGNLRKWQKNAGEIAVNDPLLFIETLPVRETRDYVKAVLTNYMIYRDRAGQPIRSLSDLSSEKSLRSFSAGKLASN